MYRMTETVKHLLIINVIMFIGTVTVGGGELFYNLFALHFPKNSLFQPWQIITHMFMHGGLTHILFNMFALWMFGTAVEQQFGGRKFLFFYISAGLGAALIMLGYNYLQYINAEKGIEGLNMGSELVKKIVSINASDGMAIRGDLLSQKMLPILKEYNFNPGLLDQSSFKALFDMNVIGSGTMVGASGAIMGVLVAFGMLFPEAKLMLIFLPIPVKAKYFIPAIIGLDLFSAITGTSIFSPSNTAYVAHVGGALTGFLIMMYWKKTQFNKNRWDR